MDIVRLVREEFDGGQLAEELRSLAKAVGKAGAKDIKTFLADPKVRPAYLAFKHWEVRDHKQLNEKIELCFMRQPRCLIGWCRRRRLCWNLSGWPGQPEMLGKLLAHCFSCLIGNSGRPL